MNLLCAQTDKYCWIHRVGNHTSKEYNHRVQGYKQDATFEDKQGESIAHYT